MISSSDRKMFAPLRNRESVAPESKLCTMLNRYDAGADAANLADALVHDGFAVGTRALVTKRISEMLESLEDAGRVERIPDGRYRVVRSRRPGERG